LFEAILFCCIPEVRELQRHLEDDEVGMILPKNGPRMVFKKATDLVVISYYFLCLIGDMIHFFDYFFNRNRRYAGPNFPAFVKMQDFTLSIY